MELGQLEALSLIARYSDSTQAALELGISSSQLVYSIELLEEELGITLVEFIRDVPLLTPIGKIMADRAKQITALTQDMKERADSEKDPFTGTLKIGGIPTILPYLMPDIIPAFTQRYPALSPLLREHKAEELLKLLDEGELDVIITTIPLASTHLEVIPVLAEDLVLATHYLHPLAKEENLTFEDLLPYEILLMEEGHCLRDHVLEICSYAGLKESSLVTGNSLESLRNMILANVGISFIPKLAATPLGGNISYIPVHHPTPARSIGLVFRSSSGKKPCIEAFAKSIASRF